MFKTLKEWVGRGFEGGTAVVDFYNDACRGSDSVIRAAEVALKYL